MEIQLPERSPEAEDLFLERWRESDDTEGLLEAVTAAIQARRPQLAARLVGLIDEHVEVPEGSPVDRARRAAQLLMMPQSRPEDFDELAEAWVLARAMRMRRLNRRLRLRQYGIPVSTRGSGRFRW